MPFGTLKSNGNPIPQFAPPYTTASIEVSKVNILSIAYRTTFESVCHLVPEELELEDEPLVTAMIVDYEMSTLGAYKEYVHHVEVEYQGEKFDFFLSLILNNEAAIFSDRERFGYPKKFGQVELNLRTGSSIMTGHVERPVGQKLGSIQLYTYTKTQY